MNTQPTSQQGAPASKGAPLFVCQCGRRWVRDHKHDRRIGHGDDFAGDCWRQIGTGARRYAVPGFVPMHCWACWGTDAKQRAGVYVSRPDLMGLK